ncbi:hypothetical protein LINPERPRIM_LOCUS15713 [Linum perenne]
MRVELRSIIEGMRLAWDEGIRKLAIQTGFRAAVALIVDSTFRRHRHVNLVDHFQSEDLDLGTHVFSIPDNSLLYSRCELTALY